MKKLIDYRLSMRVCGGRSAENPESWWLRVSFFEKIRRQTSFPPIFTGFYRFMTRGGQEKPIFAARITDSHAVAHFLAAGDAFWCGLVC